ncbi:MAG TPA: FixH family protein, partial [Stellaceae bacterium]|nr:FixH family protein [Stellaceae bacterium]
MALDSLTALGFSPTSPRPSPPRRGGEGAGTSAWRFFPLAVALALAGVVAVDAGFIWSALASFPGAVDEHAFDTGNSYNRVLDEAAREAALGWHVEVAADGRSVAVTLSDADGKALPGVSVHAVAAHPVGP